MGPLNNRWTVSVLEAGSGDLRAVREILFHSSLQASDGLLATLAFSGGADGKESAWNAGDLGLIPGLGRFPWGRPWQPTPVFLPGKIPWTEEHGGLQSTGSQRVGHD